VHGGGANSRDDGQQPADKDLTGEMGGVASLDPAVLFVTHASKVACGFSGVFRARSKPSQARIKEKLPPAKKTGLWNPPASQISRSCSELPSDEKRTFRHRSTEKSGVNTPRVRWRTAV
jgi:hypothetical protein